MAAFLTAFIPRICGEELVWKPIDYGSKQQLLARLPQRLRGYANYDPVYRPKTLVLLDRDDDDCAALKKVLEDACIIARLNTKSRPASGGSFDVVNRVVVEELEAWFFGDVDGLQQVWPGIQRQLNQAAYRDPDAIRGGTHEALLRVIKAAGHLRGAEHLPKIDVARTMGAILNPERNRSCSFGHFLTGLQSLLAAA